MESMHPPPASPIRVLVLEDSPDDALLVELELKRAGLQFQLQRMETAEALEAAFGLKELIWVEGKEQTYIAFEPHVARPDVAAVVLAIRWSSHGFGEVREFCTRYGKPLVRLPGGYSPNQVAYHILTQVGDRLAGKAVTEG